MTNQSEAVNKALQTFDASGTSHGTMFNWAVGICLIVFILLILALVLYGKGSIDKMKSEYSADINLVFQGVLAFIGIVLFSVVLYVSHT